jgi:hypothetical protein
MNRTVTILDPNCLKFQTTASGNVSMVQVIYCDSSHDDPLQHQSCYDDRIDDWDTALGCDQRRTHRYCVHKPETSGTSDTTHSTTDTTTTTTTVHQRIHTLSHTNGISSTNVLTSLNTDHFTNTVVCEGKYTRGKQKTYKGPECLVYY